MLQSTYELLRDECPPVGTIQVLVPRALVKTIKTALEVRGKLEKKLKIRHGWFPENTVQVFPEAGPVPNESLYQVPTTRLNNLPYDDEFCPRFKSEKSQIAKELGLDEYCEDIYFCVIKPKDPSCSKAKSTKSAKRGPLAEVVEQWLLDLPEEVVSTLPAPIMQLVSLSSWSFDIYDPLFLLPKSTFEKEPWPELFANTLQAHVPRLYDSICKKWKVTHVAINAPIPLISSSFAGSPSLNILRSPTSLTPLYGFFGEPNQSPSPAAFKSALWVSTRQYSIYQTWAPVHTMFSRGNIREKHRILSMPELGSETLGYDASQSSAVDMYAGIGYFAFCYASREVGKVICFEINGWSVEGLRRGAAENGWGSILLDDKDSNAWIGAKEKLLVIPEDNRNAGMWIGKMRGSVPPVRHVNCGLLPSSKECWETAIRVLDPVEGGWIHVHENIGDKEVDKRTLEISETFRNLATNAGLDRGRKIYCEHVERVKSYAPGVIHCVLDIHFTSVQIKTPRACSAEPPG